ncbi:hypothetical protein Syun_008019 [Stephania yunnanensis]|uniref:Exopolyphosphatase n=1 Tax=Stephania yunnanensis TaxID=152371 RepID=A0AAP0PZC1_9MAGN
MSTTSPNLVAAVDMGTNSFKMLIVRADPTGRFISTDRFKEPVVLGQGMASHDQPNNPSISAESQSRGIAALQKFAQLLQRNRIDRARLVATSAVRDAANRDEFLARIADEVSFDCIESVDVQVLSGEEEARLIYMGVCQFMPFFDKTVLTVDIGGGSTEFSVGKGGEVVFAASLKLGHVCLTDRFVRSGEFGGLRGYIRSVIRGSGVVEKVKGIGVEVVVGSSGTIQAIGRAVSSGYARDSSSSIVGSEGLRRNLRFSREELCGVVEKLCECETQEVERMRKDWFFKRRSEFIVAGAVLLQEIFEVLGIDEMEVSRYALGEGVIAETLAECCECYDINANPRWRSVVGLAERFNNQKRMDLASRCTITAKEFFSGLRRFHQNKHILSLNEKDLECVEAACILHNIGQYVGKEGYHKQSYHMIKGGDYLHGYNVEEVKLISLLVRHHRKKFPKCDHHSFRGLPEEITKKFRILCAIVRVSIAVQRQQGSIFRRVETSNDQKGFLLMFSSTMDQVPGCMPPTVQDLEDALRTEMDFFEE